MQYADLLNIVLPRAERLGLDADAALLQVEVFAALVDVVSRYDLDEYVVYNPAVVTTQAGVDTYPLPPEFGRLLHTTTAGPGRPQAQGKSGFWLFDGTTNLPDLQYRSPVPLIRSQLEQSQGTPTEISITSQSLRLAPPPDSNNDAHYVVRGIYIERVPFPELEEFVRLSNPLALVDYTLYRMALERGLAQTQLLQAEAQKSLGSLVYHQHRRQFASYRQPYQTTRRR